MYRYNKKDAHKRGILPVFGGFSAIFGILAVFSDFSLFTTLFRSAYGGRHKLGNGKVHILEKRARIASALVTAGAAFLFGHCAGGCVHNNLRGALDTDNGKDAEGNEKDSTLGIIAKRAGKRTANAFGNLAATARTAASAADLGNAHVKHYGINRLNNGGGSVGAAIDIAYLAIAAKALTA